MGNISIINRLVLLAAMMLLFITPLCAQRSTAVFSNSRIENYSVNNGLLSNQVNCINFDDAGFLWIGTMYGICRFDGQHLTSAFNNFWNVQPVISFMGKRGDTLLAMRSRTVIKIIKGNIITGDRYQFTKNGLRLDNLCTTSSMFNYMSDSEFDDFFKRDSLALLFAGCIGVKKGEDSLGLAGYDGFRTYVKGHLAKKLPYPTPIDYDSRRLVQPFSEGVAMINTQKGCLDLYLMNGTVVQQPLPAAAESCKLYLGQNGHTFFIAAGKNLYEAFMPSTGKGLVFRKMLDDFIDSTGITFMLNRDDRFLIMGSTFKGLYIYAKNKISTFRAPSTVSNNYFYAHALLADGKTRLAQGKVMFDSMGYKGTINQPPPNDDDHNMQNSAYLVDRKGFYWYLKYVNQKLGLYKGRFFEDPLAQLISDDIGEMYCMLEDVEGNVWVQKQNSLGYFEKGTTHYVMVTPDSIDVRKKFGQLISLAEDKKGNIYFGTAGGLYSLPKGALHVFPRLLGFKGHVIFCQQPDKKDRIWVCADSGLYVLTPPDKLRFVPWNRRYSDGYILGMAFDQQDRVWITAGNGLFVTTRQSLDDFVEDSTHTPFFYRFSARDGFPREGATGGAQYTMICSADGQLSVSTEAGLAWLNTKEAEHLFPQSELYLQTIINGNVKALTNDEVLHLKHTENKNVNFSLSFADWNDENNIETGYLFEKKDEEDEVKQWHELTSDNNIFFPFLPTGEYRLTVRKRTGFGPDSYHYLSITIKVAPRWYETRWFYLAVIFTGLLLVAFIGFTRNRILVRHNKRLNMLINNATKELAQKNDELENKNVELASHNETKNKLLSLFSHDISIPLFYVNRTLTQIMEDKEFYQVSPELGETINAMENTTADLNVLLNDILYWIKIQQENADLQVKREEVIVKNVIDRILKLFRFRIAEQNITVNIDLDEDFTIRTDERLFTSIVYNVLANAIKFAFTGFFTVRLETGKPNSNHFSLIFENSVADAKADTVNKTNYTDDPKNQDLNGRGIGLTLVKDFATRLGYDVQINLRHGDTFVLVIAGLIDNNAG